MESFILGHEVQHNDQAWLVVRIVASTSIFEDESGLVLIDEKYIQLRALNGDIDFVILHETEQPYTRTSTIKALPSIPWRKNVKSNV